jgi:5-methyltetrahydrofolate--homocysteine methyltransferase
MDELGSGENSPAEELAEIAPRIHSHRVDVLDPALYTFTGEKSDVEPVSTPPPLPFYGARSFTKFDIFELYKYINPIALFRGQWQFKRPSSSTLG